jgi:hypothetical protein
MVWDLEAGHSILCNFFLQAFLFVHCEFPHREFRKLCRISILKPKISLCDTFPVHNTLLEYGLLFQGISKEVKLLQIGIIFGVLQDDARNIQDLAWRSPRRFQVFFWTRHKIFCTYLSKNKVYITPCLLEDEQVFKHGGGATKKVLCCLEFTGACRKKKRRKK